MTESAETKAKGSANNTMPNGTKVEPAKANPPTAEAANADASKAPTDTAQKPALTGKEAKEAKAKAKAEKQARRAAQKGGEAEAGPSAQTNGAAIPRGKVQQKQPQSKETSQKGQQQKQAGKPGQEAKGQSKPPGTPQTPTQSKTLPPRRRGSQGAEGAATKEIKPSKAVGLFGHLYTQQRRQSIHNANKDIHPATLALGLQYSNYIICGSTARCVAMLLAFKTVILDYTTPPGTSLARHLTNHLSPQISYLNSCRPLSISMGNSIRWLKDLIIKIDPAVPEQSAKDHLLSSIDTFIRERISAAGDVIAENTAKKIDKGDVIATYAKSSVVLNALLYAHQEQNKRFRVVIIDSKPLFEGRRLASTLADAGIEVQYTLLSGAAHVLKDATKVLLGAHAMMSNGRLYSRAGTAIVAMHASARDIPVIVCAESVKFTERVALDSVVNNEIANSDELLDLGGPVGGSGAGEDALEEERKKRQERKEVLKLWEDTNGLQVLNVLFDVTPAEYIKMVVTEYGSLPPSSVPVVHRISTNT